MKKQMLLSSIMATSLVGSGTGWAATPGDETGDPNGAITGSSSGETGAPSDVVDAVIRARLASATVYTAENREVSREWNSASVLLLKPGGAGQELYHVSMGPEDLEMIIRITDKEGSLDEYGNGNSDDVYFYLKFLTSFNQGNSKTYLGFSCNSSQSCETGETFLVSLDGENLLITRGVYGNTESVYLPSFMVGVNLKKS